MLRINYVVPSWGRAKTITTLSLLSKTRALVSEDQVEDYKRFTGLGDDRFIVCPREFQGHGKGIAQNWMLDNCWEDYDAVLSIDDDITRFRFHDKVDGENTEGTTLTEQQVYEYLENACEVAYEWGCGMFGISINHDPMVYDEFKPFRTLAYIDGGVVGFVRDDGLRYDTELTVKEDVDYFLQSVARYHKALRFEKLFVNKGAFTNEGGCQDIRTDALEQKQFKMMQKKWGSNVIRPNAPTAKKGSKIRGAGGAIKLRIPIDGV